MNLQFLKFLDLPTLKRLAKEFWLPLLLAAVWTGFGVLSGGGYDIKGAVAKANLQSIIANFATSFFFLSWLSGQVFRVKKQAHVEAGLASVEQRIGVLLSKIEAQTESLLGYSVGGINSAKLVMAIGGAVSHPGRQLAMLHLMNESQYPIFDVRIDLLDMDEPIDRANGRLWTNHRWECPHLYPTKAYTDWRQAYQFDVTDKARLRLNVTVFTRNDVLICQFLMLRDKSGQALVASKIGRAWGQSEQNIPAGFPGYDPARGNVDELFHVAVE